MAIHHLTLEELCAADGSPSAVATGDVVLVDLDAGSGSPPSGVHGPGIVVGLTTDALDADHPAAAACDVVLPQEDPSVEQVLATVRRVPLAAWALVVHMRSAPRATIDAGLEEESTVYSALQAGPEFAAWLATRPARSRAAEGPPVALERDGGSLQITLQRPNVRNALDPAMRDALVDAFSLPALDPSITEVHLRGEGPSFCAGGDLDTFGTFPDPETAHRIRLQQSVGRAISLVGDRVTAHLHGACAGSGIELPAFAGRVIARADTRISLPELSLGLIPGAGGTESLPRRIGRHRTTRLALTGEVLDATTALQWGLVDAVT
ncbi:MAG: enoyl-CoA hydratase/isomerase family protein [Acidimicrobiales bacterium]